jgi:uncharacterized membrane protein
LDVAFLAAQGSAEAGAEASVSFFGVREGKFMVEQPKKDTPFGLDQNVAAGLAYLFSWVGGLVMLVGGGTNKFVRWAAAQSIVIGVSFTLLRIIMVFLWLPMLTAGLWTLYGLISLVVWLGFVAIWLWTFITAFQGKEVRVPVFANLTESIFKSSL